MVPGLDQGWKAACKKTRGRPQSFHKVSQLAPNAWRNHGEEGMATTESSLDAWLAQAGLVQYSAQMKQYGYDSFNVLQAATLADIVEMIEDPDIGMTKSHRRLFLTQWARTPSEGEPPEPEPEPEPEESAAGDAQVSAEPQTIPRPPPFGGVLPGCGEAVPEQTTLHPFVGEHRQQIVVTQPPDEGWEELLRLHTRFYVQEIEAPAKRLATGSPGFEEICARRFGACRLFLAAWPRGTAAGELLSEPIIDETPPRNRGVNAEWWMEVARRAAFVPTRIFVEAFVKPVTRAAQCALWFFIPEQFRQTPDASDGVFISHAWDLSMWDIRPEEGSIVWLDTLAVVQHRAVVPDGAPAEEAYPELLDLVPTVQMIANTLLILGGDAHGLLPLARSWCCFEVAHTPPGKLRVRAGWSTWELDEQTEIRHGIDALDMAQAEAFDQDDKKMIDDLVVKKFGSFENANRVIRSSVLHGYFEAVAEAYQLAPSAAVDIGHTKSEEETVREIERSLERAASAGQRPLLDKRILALFVNAEDEKRFEELDRAPSLQEWAREAARKFARDAPPPPPPTDQASQLTAAHYDFVISYDELNSSSEALAFALYAEIRKRGKSMVSIRLQDSLVTEAEVRSSKCVIAVISGPQGGDDTGYFNNSSCLQMLRWATEAEVCIQPIVAAEAKCLISEFCATIPADLYHLTGLNWQLVDRKDVDNFEVGVTKVLRGAGFFSGVQQVSLKKNWMHKFEVSHGIQCKKRPQYENTATGASSPYCGKGCKTQAERNLSGSVSGPWSVAPSAGIGAVIERGGGAASRLQETSSGAAPISSPGRWDFTISYTQRNPYAELLAEAVYSSLRERGKTAWLDIKTQHLNLAAMMEAAQNSRVLIAIVTGPFDSGEGDPEDNSYFKDEHCLMELRWARDAGVPIQPVFARDDKGAIGHLLTEQCPLDLMPVLTGVDWKPMDRMSHAIWKTCMDELVKSADALVQASGGRSTDTAAEEAIPPRSTEAGVDLLYTTKNRH